MQGVNKLKTEKRWVNKETDAFFKSTKLDKIIVQILCSRGIKTEEEGLKFLSPEYDDLTDPFDLPDMKKAVEVITENINNKGRIVIYGDYDVDGITATALLVTFFEQIGVEAKYYIPSRQDEGYGLNKRAIEKIADQGAGLIITVDCGTNSIEEVQYAKKRGLKIIVTDHHAINLVEGQECLPNADAVVNPKRETSTGCELAGVGVAFYLVRALQNEFAAKFPAGQEKWLMDLVALGTICDVVPLVKDNRILAAFGLKVLNKTRNKGIRALANTAGINQEEIGVYQTGFLLGPRLNAAGRLETAQAAIELLLTKEKAEAAKMAGKLTELNKQRQELTAKIVEEAKEQIKKFDQNKKIFLVSKKGWPHGIVGIVASRLTEEYSRPVLVMEEGTEVLKGSARSIKNFDIVAAIGQCHSLLNRFGGHRFAAGFELKKENLSLFQEMLEEIAGREISAEDMIPQVDIDTEITMDKVDLDLLDQLKRLEPHGMGNPRPVFTLRGVRINACRLVGSPSVHLKMAVEQNDKLLMGMSFNHGENINFDINKKMDLAVTLNENIWKNKRNVEFLLVDAKQI